MNPPASFRLRRLAQRYTTTLPRGHAAFSELFAPDRENLAGIFACRAPFTGIVRAEAGRPFVLQPTRYADGQPGSLATEDRVVVTAEPDRKVFAMADAIVRGADGVVYDPSSRLVIRETIETWDTPIDQHPIFATPRFPAPQKLRGISLLLGALGGQTFYHFFIENLPKLAFARDLLRSVDHVLVSRYAEESKRRWLSSFFPEDKIVWLGELAHVRCEQLLFTGRLVRHFEPNPWAVQALRALFPAEPAPKDSPRVVWLDRKAVANRQFEQEHDFAARIGSAVPVDFGALEPRDTARVCAGARALVGLHGAAFSNMIFCAPGTKVIEIMTRPFYPWYARLAQICGLRHLAVRLGDDSEAIARAASAVTEFLAEP